VLYVLWFRIPSAAEPTKVEAAEPEPVAAGG
jgi:hypothetical protein